MRVRALVMAMTFAIGCVAVGAASAGSARPSGATHPRAAKVVTVTVTVGTSSPSFIDSGVKIAKGKSAAIQVSGDGTCHSPSADDCPVGPKGAGYTCASNPHGSVPPGPAGADVPYGAVAGRVGSGKPFYIGASKTASGPGELFLVYNDCGPPGGYADNGGSFQVKISYDKTCCACALQRATVKAAPKAVHSAASNCGTISLSPRSNLRVGKRVTISGSDWNATKGDVALSLRNPDTGKRLDLLGRATPVGKSGTFTFHFKLDKFTKRNVYPHVQDGCAVGVIAQQGKHTATDKGTSPGEGHVAYASYGAGGAPFKTGQVYCLGENPIDGASANDVVITVPASASSSPVPGLVPYRVAADPYGVSLKGGSAPELYVGGDLCMRSPDGDLIRGISISPTQQTARVGLCAHWPPEGPGSQTNAAVESYGAMHYPTRQSGIPCIDLADQTFGNELQLAQQYVGNLDCSFDLFTAQVGIRAAAPVFQSGSLRISPALAFDSGFLVVSGSLSATRGIATTGTGSLVIVGRDATFSLGPPRRLTPHQKAEYAKQSEGYGHGGNNYTYAGLALAILVKTVPQARAASWAADLLTLLSATGAAYNDVTGSIVADPPDRHYRAIATAAAKLPSVIRPGNGLNKADAKTLSALAKNLSASVGAARALQTAINRAGGAANAHHRAAEKKQITAASKYARSWALLLDREPKLLKGAVRVLQKFPGVSERRPTSSDYATIQNDLRDHGLPPKVAKIQRLAGLTAAQIGYETHVLTAGSTPALRTTVELVGDPSLRTLAAKQAKLLRAFAQSAPKTIGRRRG